MFQAYRRCVVAAALLGLVTLPAAGQGSDWTEGSWGAAIEAFQQAWTAVAGWWHDDSGHGGAAREAMPEVRGAAQESQQAGPPAAGERSPDAGSDSGGPGEIDEIGTHFEPVG